MNWLVVAGFRGEEPIVNEFRDGRSAMANARAAKAEGGQVAVYQEVPVSRGGGKPKSPEAESAPSKSKRAAKRAKKRAAKKAPFIKRGMLGGVAAAAAKKKAKGTGEGGVANPVGLPEASAGSSGETE